MDKAAFQRWIDALTSSFLGGDPEEWIGRAAFPHTMQVRAGVARVPDRATMERDFALYLEVFRINRVTDMVRIVKNVEEVEPGLIRATYETRIMSGSMYVVDPYTSVMTLRLDPDGKWRFTEVLNAVGHYHWRTGAAATGSGPVATGNQAVTIVQSYLDVVGAALMGGRIDVALGYFSLPFTGRTSQLRHRCETRAEMRELLTAFAGAITKSGIGDLRRRCERAEFVGEHRIEAFYSTIAFDQRGEMVDQHASELTLVEEDGVWLAKGGRSNMQTDGDKIILSTDSHGFLPDADETSSRRKT